MSNVKICVENEKLLALTVLLSNYDFFRIVVDSESKFCATQIVGRGDGYLEFKRLFATSVYTDGALVKIYAETETVYVCETNNRIYRIYALHRKQHQIPIRPQKKLDSVVDLMDISYFGDRFFTYDKEQKILTYVVDPYELGELTKKEQFQIKNIINIYLGGLSASMQICRTVCFQIQMDNGRNKIYAGIYDLEHQRPITSKLIFDELDVDIIPEDLYVQSCFLLEHANSCIKNA